MIEAQIINRILKSKSLTIVRQNNIDSDYFISYNAEFKFIEAHYGKYGVVPDVETFLATFNDFDLIEVHESDQYLVETLQEQYIYSKMVPFVHKIAELVQVNAQDAVDFAKTNLEEISKLSARYRAGYDIVKNSDDRRNEYKYRLEVEGLLGISTGIEALDAITHGWLKEDFVAIVGRTNEGKSWILLFFLVAAWKSGIPVLLYSGEMSKEVVGFRFDTLNEHVSNLALMRGQDKLGKDDDPKTPNDYYEYLNNLSTNETPFIVVTPKDIGGRRLTIPILHQLIEQYKPGIVGVDQLSLMDDYRAAKGEQTRMKYTHISEDLYLTSEKYGIPILTPVQANRDSAKEKKDSENTPELHQINESDGIGQNATRVVSMKQLGVTLKLSIKKNRYGLNNQEIMTLWDIDKGIIRPFLVGATNPTTKDFDVHDDKVSGEDLF